MNELTRQQAIETISLQAVEAVERENCDFTNRVMDNGWVEFSATLETEEGSLVAYYYQTQDAVDACEQLDELDWEIDHYKVY